MLTINEKKEEPLMARTMVSGTLEFEKATPSYADVTKELANGLKADEKLIAVRHVYTDFGAKKAKVIAYVYKDDAKKQFIEPKIKIKKSAQDAAKK